MNFSISLQLNRLVTEIWKILKFLSWYVLLNLIEYIRAQTCNETFIIPILRIWVVNYLLHIWFDRKTSHRLNDCLPSTAVPFWCSSIDEHQSSHFFFYKFNEFTSCSSDFMLLHFHFLHQRMLFNWDSTTAYGNFSLSVCMLFLVKSLPFFPGFFQKVVFIAKFRFIGNIEQFRSYENSGTENALFGVF